MVANRKVTGRAWSVPAGIGMGVAVAMMITLTGALLTAWLIHWERIPQDAVGYCAMVILLMASAAGAYTAQWLVKRQRMVVCAVASAAYYGALLAVTALFFGGQYQGMGVTAAVVFCGCAIIILLGLKEGRGHNPKIKKYRYG